MRIRNFVERWLALNADGADASLLITLTEAGARVETRESSWVAPPPPAG